jgi:hypothetical protein
MFNWQLTGQDNGAYTAAVLLSDITNAVMKNPAEAGLNLQQPSQPHHLVSGGVS